MQRLDPNYQNCVILMNANVYIFTSILDLIRCVSYLSHC